MPSNEDRLRAQRSKLQAQLDALKRRERILDAQDRAIARRKREQRLRQVGLLVEAAGLLDTDDGWLEKMLRQVADALAPVDHPPQVATT